jgi:acetoacetate decarboxylase
LERHAALHQRIIEREFADVAQLPVRQVVSALHFKADLTLELGSVAFDYLAK